MENPGIVNERVAQNWHRRFKESNNLEDKPRSERPCVVLDDALLEMVEQPSTNNRILSAEYGPSQSKIDRHFDKLNAISNTK